MIRSAVFKCISQPARPLSAAWRDRGHRSDRGPVFHTSALCMHVASVVSTTSVSDVCSAFCSRSPFAVVFFLQDCAHCLPTMYIPICDVSMPMVAIDDLSENTRRYLQNTHDSLQISDLKLFECLRSIARMFLNIFGSNKHTQKEEAKKMKTRTAAYQLVQNRMDSWL